MSDMIERVAKALWVDVYGDDNQRDYPKEQKIFLRQARAAIAAMRDPTPEMIDAGRMLVRDCRQVWKVMHAALAGKEPK